MLFGVSFVTAVVAHAEFTAKLLRLKTFTVKFETLGFLALASYLLFLFSLLLLAELLDHTLAIR